MHSLTVLDLWIREIGSLFRRDDSRSKWKGYLGIGIAAGIGAVALHTYDSNQAREFSAGFVLAGASLFLGILVGFIFGIPKTAKAKAEDPSPASRDAGQASYRLNTNLEEISDWLTKMLIGVGLVQLTSIPSYLKKVALFWQSSIGSDFPAAYVAAIITFFCTIGFLVGYLWTRLALIEDFIEQDPQQLIKKLINDIAEEAEKDPNIATPQADRQAVRLQELRAAEAIANISTTSRVALSDLKKSIDILAAKYESLRATMPSGFNRTREMEIVASQMRGYTLAAYGLLADYANSDSAGKRLVAIGFLETKPNPQYFEWLAERFREETPFLQYHAAMALRNATKQGLSGAQMQQLQSACTKALDYAMEAAKKHNGSLESSQIVVLQGALKILGV